MGVWLPERRGDREVCWMDMDNGVSMRMAVYIMSHVLIIDGGMMRGLHARSQRIGMNHRQISGSAYERQPGARGEVGTRQSSHIV